MRPRTGRPWVPPRSRPASNSLDLRAISDSPGRRAPGESTRKENESTGGRRGRQLRAAGVSRVAQGDAVVPVTLVTVVLVLGAGELALGVLVVGVADGAREGDVGGRVAAAVARRHEGRRRRVVGAGGVGGGCEGRSGEGQRAEQDRSAGEGGTAAGESGHLRVPFVTDSSLWPQAMTRGVV